MISESNKVVYEAQKFIRTLIKALNIEDHTGKKDLISNSVVVVSVIR